MCYLLKQLLYVATLDLLYARNVPSPQHFSNISGNQSMVLAPVAACPNNWLASRENPFLCYSLPNLSSDVGVSWWDAGSFCARKTATLVTPKTPQQLTDIYEGLWQNMDSASVLYVGLEKFFGYWTWLDGTNFTMHDYWCDDLMINADDALFYDETCAVVRWNENSPSQLCFQPIKCSKYLGYDVYTACQKLEGPMPVCDSPSWLPMSGTDNCYFISKALDKTYWDRAFCSCMDMGAILSPLESWAEGVWLAGNVFKAEQLDQNVASSPLMVGLTSLYPYSGWNWVQGLKLENYTAPFWPEKKLPQPLTDSNSMSGDWCAAISWENTSDKPTIYNPKMQTWGCISGKANFVCKKNKETAQNIFPAAAVKLQKTLCNPKM